MTSFLGIYTENPHTGDVDYISIIALQEMRKSIMDMIVKDLSTESKKLMQLVTKTSTICAKCKLPECYRFWRPNCCLKIRDLYYVELNI